MRTKIVRFLQVSLLIIICIFISNFIFNNDSLYIDSYNYNSSGVSGKIEINTNGISNAVNKVYDSVVMIENYSSKELQGTGSGFIYKKTKDYGYILTNQHVVEKSDKLYVKVTSGDKVEAKLLGGDEYLDVAVIRISSKYVKTVASIGSTDKLNLGDFVFTIGSPVGEEYFNSVTSGIISGLNRKVTVSIKSTNDWVMDVIQLDAAINPGNSGGPLVNLNGEVIGMNSLKLVDSQIEGMGFSIKIEDALAHVFELEKGNNIEWPLLGINYTEITNDYLLKQENITIRDDINYGVVVISTVEDTAAYKAGLKKGDVIIGIDDSKVSNSAYLKYILYKYKAGDKIKIKYNRNGKIKTASVTLTKNN